MSPFSKLIALTFTLAAFSALNASANNASNSGDEPACESKCGTWVQYASHAPLGCFEARSCTAQEMHITTEGKTFCGDPVTGEPVTTVEHRVVQLGVQGYIHCMPEAY